MGKIDWDDPEQVREYYREYDRTKRNKEAELARKKKYREENKEKCNASGRRRYQETKETVSAHKKQYRLENPEQRLLTHAKSRSKKKGIECSIELSDIVIPDVCPVFGIPLRIATEPCTPHSPSIDRIDASRGYTKDNVWVISWRANTLKHDGSLGEFERLVISLEGVQGGIWLPSKPFVKHKGGQGEDPITKIIKQARNRATKLGVEFSLEHSDVIMPDVCPVLGIPLFRSKGKATPNSPSIDRIDPSKGYIKGNVWIISSRANTLKNNGTLEEFKALIKAWRSKLEEMRLLKTG